MILLAGAAAVGLLVSLACLNRVDTGTTWWEWRDSDPPRWFLRMQYVLVAMLFAGFVAWFLPGEVRAVLIGIPAGFCVPPLVIGIRRWLVRGERPPEPVYEVVEEEPEPPRRPFWQRLVIIVAWAAPFSVAIGLVLGMRREELVVMAILGPFAVLVQDAATGWARRRGLE